MLLCTMQAPGPAIDPKSQTVKDADNKNVKISPNPQHPALTVPKMPIALPNIHPPGRRSLNATPADRQLNKITNLLTEP